MTTPRMSKNENSRGANWKPQEDVVLCLAWISISEDGSIGTNQEGNTFWNRVYHLFLQNSSTDPPRPREGIESRFKIINYECSVWLSSTIKARKIQRSGTSLEDVDNDAKVIFMNDHKPKDKLFKLYHAWNILKDFPKWQKLHQSPMERSTQHVDDYTVNLDDDESDTVTPTPMSRPEGRDKQKATNKKGKMQDDSVTRCADHMGDLVQQSKDFKEYRRRKLELIEQQVALEKEEKKERIMAMDLSKYTPRKKKYWSDKQDAILDSHAAQAVPSNYENNSDDYYPSPPRY